MEKTMATTRKRTWTTATGESKEAWVVTYADSEGKRRTKTFDRKKDADAFRTTVAVEIRNGTHTPNSMTKTVRTIYDEFSMVLERRNRDGASMGDVTLAHFKGDMERHILPLVGGIRANQLSFDDVMRVVDRMRTNGLSARTVKSRLYYLRNTLDFGIRRGYIATNITSAVMKELGPIRAAKVATFTTDEISRLLNVARTKKYNGSARAAAQIEIFVNIAVFCGLRKGEIYALAWDAIDLTNLVISVRKSITRKNEIKGPKTEAGVRDVPFPPHLVDLFRSWRLEHYRINEGGYLFYVGVQGSSLKKFAGGDMAHSWYDLMARADIPPLAPGKHKHFHSLRHFAASYWIDSGLPVTEVAHMLGHATFDETLQTYAHPLVKRDRQINVLNGMAFDLRPEQVATKPRRSIGVTCST